MTNTPDPSSADAPASDTPPASDSPAPGADAAPIDKRLQRRGRQHWRRVVLLTPPANRHTWLTLPDTIRQMGAEWCNRRLAELDAYNLRLRQITPSDAWHHVAWHGEAVFPPQDDFCPLAVAATLYGLAADGLIRERGQFGLRASIALLTAGADPLQVWARTSCRMRFASIHIRAATDRYDEHGHPIMAPPTRRLTPPGAITSEDRYDAMSPGTALFCTDPPSVSALMIQRLAMMRGRDQTKLDRERKRRAEARRQKIAAIKARYGIDDD